MGYGDNKGLSVSIREDQPLAGVPDQPKTIVIFSTDDTTQFGVVLRLLNAHKVKYKIEGASIGIEIAE